MSKDGRGVPVVPRIWSEEPFPEADDEVYLAGTFGARGRETGPGPSARRLEEGKAVQGGESDLGLAWEGEAGGGKGGREGGEGLAEGRWDVDRAWGGGGVAEGGEEGGALGGGVEAVLVGVGAGEEEGPESVARVS